MCSLFYISSTQKSLDKRNRIIRACYGNPDYAGKGYMLKMLDVLNKYCVSIGKKYIFTKAYSENIYSINNMYKDGYKFITEYESERGLTSVFLKSS